MRVALVGSHSARRTAGGSAGEPARAAYLAAALARRGLDVTLFSAAAAAPGSARRDFSLVRAPAATRCLDDPDAMPESAVAAAVSELGRFLVARWMRDRPDVVHADGWSYGLAAQLAAARLDVPTVQALPELSSVVRRRQGRAVGPSTRPRFERLLARGATHAVVACTEDVVELARMGCRRDRVSVLPRGVDLAAFTSGASRGDRPATQRIVALASDLLPYRGFDDLIRALAGTRGAELVIAGGPPLPAAAGDPDVRRLREVAMRCAVAQRVRFLGALAAADVPALVRSGDVLVCPSWYEPFGTVVVEAMACGVPVIASEAGGMVDTVVHEVTGLLVPPRSPRQLAAALNEILAAGALRNGMGLAGKARVAACYSWARVAAEAHTRYERAVNASVAGCGQVTAPG